MAPKATEDRSGSFSLASVFLRASPSSFHGKEPNDSACATAFRMTALAGRRRGREWALCFLRCLEAKGIFHWRREKFEEYDDRIFAKTYHSNIINLENGLL